MIDAAPHRRRNLLTGDWVLVSAHRVERPWQGQVEDVDTEVLPEYDAGCYLCPGNARANGASNPDYSSTYVFDNDFPALLGDTEPVSSEAPLLVRAAETGRCRVICFSPRHDLTLATMQHADVGRVVDCWVDEYRQLGAEPDIRYVQIFENRGAMMGCSNPHPHGQVWAQSSIPDEPARELERMRHHYAETGTPLLVDYLATELEREERIVLANDSFVVLVPFWATWPFETLVLPRRQVASLLDLNERERADFAAAIRGIAIRYDNLFQAPFPYSAGLHQAPTDGEDVPHCTLHMHFYPPLLRSATVRKFMVGYEMLAGAQRDLTPEASAARLRELAGTHYSIDQAGA